MQEEFVMTGDIVMFDFLTDCKVMLIPPIIPIVGSSTHTITPAGMKGCIEGDETKVRLVASYVILPEGYFIPGTAQATISKLNDDQLSTQTKCDKKAVILKGTEFEAKLQVMMPCMTPNKATGIPEPHSTMSFDGKGEFQIMMPRKVTDAK